MRKAKCKHDWSVAGGIISAARWGSLCIFAVSLASAQTTPPSQEHAASSRPLTAKEGRAIVTAAREHEPEVRGKPDCSHLVHQVYRFAGFEYPYASSFNLYKGIENFIRVKAPQAGDLVAWPGHVGIVLDPARHTFYSSVRSGMRAEFYDGPYWKARGKPRFYRYVIESPNKLLLARTQQTPQSTGAARKRAAGPVKEEEADAPAPGSKQPAKEDTEDAAAGAVSSSTVVPASTTEVPASIAISSGKGKPTPEEAGEGISELCNAAGSALRADDPQKPRLPVVIFDQLHVERVETKHDHGWAHVRIDSRVSIVSGRAALKPRHEKVRWELRRTESGWEALLPSDRTYVPRDVAVRALAARLAQLTQTEGAASHEEQSVREEAQLASLLNALLQNK